MALVRVRVWGDDAEPSKWSAPATVEAGLLLHHDWKALPVGPNWLEGLDPDVRRPPLLRREFSVSGTPVKARLYVTAHGLYEVELNGARVGKETMSPGWTVYGSRLRYYTYDVTNLISQGDNAIGAWLGDGWYRGRVGWGRGSHNLYGSDISLIAQLEIVTSDGATITVATDSQWCASAGPIMSSGIYDGEVYDAREEQALWSTAGFDGSNWSAVRVGARDPSTLVAPTGPPVRCTQEVMPVGVLTTPSGKEVLDLGQNLVGRMRLRAHGERGTTIILSTAEVLQDGEICTRPLRAAKSTDTYVMAGRPLEEWEPRFTLHGFRYVQVDGWPGDLRAAVRSGDLVARVYHTDMERTGWFECSDPLVNILHENVVWGMRGNFVDVPTDCPQRDERLGWTGDIQVFAPTATFLFDCSGMLVSWLADVALEQLPDGTVPLYVPVVPAEPNWDALQACAVWGDVAVLTPWTLYERFGDAEILRHQFESAKAWVDLVDRLSGEDHLWDDGFQLGDWLDPTAPPQDPAAGATDKYLVATAYFAWSATHLALSAEALGREEEAAHYRALAHHVRQAFARRYIGPAGQLTSDSETAYALAIRFDLVPSDQLPAAAAHLVELVARSGSRIGTGFAGTPLIADALTMAGATSTAYELLLQKQCPSWLYAVTMGATTVWERWDSLLPDGAINPGQMTSFNHYAFGAVADWAHRVVAGLAPVAPGYKEILFQPRPRNGITYASARHESPYGTVAISWHLSEGRIFVDVTVPTGSTAVLDLEGGTRVPLGPGSQSFAFDFTAPH